MAICTKEIEESLAGHIDSQEIETDDENKPSD
jgi:hypothetical protein